ncbi:hypothetical protein PENTCL1PPCAC_24969, partial [Pristionchus entomophagus]
AVHSPIRSLFSPLTGDSPKCMDDCSVLPSLFLPAMAGIVLVASVAICVVAEGQTRLRIRRARLYEHFKQEFKRLRIEQRVKILQVSELVAATEEKAANNVMKRSSNESVKTGSSQNSRERVPASGHREPLLEGAETPRTPSRKGNASRKSAKDQRSKTKDQESKRDKQLEKNKKESSTRSKEDGNSRERESQKKTKKQEGTEQTDKKSSKKLGETRKSNKDKQTEGQAGEETKDNEKNLDDYDAIKL